MIYLFKKECFICKIKTHSAYAIKCLWGKQIYLCKKCYISHIEGGHYENN
jgi:hypothetical protein